MKTPDCGVELIKKWEGLSLNSYNCSAGKLTIGYGHTGDDVKEGQEITVEKAEELLRKDLETAEKCLTNCVQGNLTEGQIGALISFIFNLGCGNFRSSTLLKCVNGGDDLAAAQQFLRWNKAMVGGKLTVLDGLTARRKEEMELFLS